MRSVNRVVQPIYRKIRTDRGNRYLIVDLSVGGLHKTISVHRLVCTAFLGPQSANMQVNHRNCDKKDNRVENLEWVTPQQNSQHSSVCGRLPIGEDNFASKLTSSKIVAIRTLRTTGLSYQKIAKMFGVTRGAIQYACVRKTWKHVR